MVLVSFGALVGKVDPLQILTLVLIELPGVHLRILEASQAKVEFLIPIVSMVPMVPMVPEASRLPCYCWNKVVFLQLGSEKTPLVPGSRVAVAKAFHQVPLRGIHSRVKWQKWGSLRLSNCPIYSLLCQTRNPQLLEVSILHCAPSKSGLP